ncbi:MAG: FdtA/QdtA family cupin domain-containing protein [Patescibacteria group bacterium]
MSKLIKLIKVSKIIDDCTLCVIQDLDLPFKIRRVYYIIYPKKGLLRGAHAHLKNKQVLFCIRGSVRIVLDDGSKKESVVLSEPNIGIVLDKMIWHEMCDMNKDSLLLVLASDLFAPDDYIRDYNAFVRLTKNEKKKN